jgi:hypothetical protein
MFWHAAAYLQPRDHLIHRAAMRDRAARDARTNPNPTDFRFSFAQLAFEFSSAALMEK